MFLSPPLKTPLRMSGTAIVDLQASLSKTQSNLDRVRRRLRPEHADHPHRRRRREHQPGRPHLLGRVRCRTTSPCFIETTKPQQTVTQWRVTKGMMDSSNRNSLRDAEPVTIGTKYRFTWPELPEDFTFAAGHRIGIIIGGELQRPTARPTA